MSAICYPGSFDPPTVAHLAIARAARRALGADRVVWVISRIALAKEHVRSTSLDHRVEVLREAAREHEWLGVAVTDAQLLVDIASGYDAVVMGADKWHQIHDVAFYDGDPQRRDRAVAALPRPLVVPRGDLHVPAEHALRVPGTSDVSSTRARAGDRDLMLPAARRFDEATGAWTEAAPTRDGSPPRRG